MKNNFVYILFFLFLFYNQTVFSQINSSIDFYNEGLKYYNGEGVNVNYYEAFKLFKVAAEKGNANAQYALGECYENGRGVVMNYGMGLKWYRRSAKKGNPKAQEKIGAILEWGLGGKVDLAQAVKWYRKAAEQGYAPAQNELGVCYRQGNGVKKDLSECIKWYRKAAEQGHALAQLNLGYCYENGSGVQTNYEEAARWYQKAADQGEKIAQNSLGDCYRYGKGIIQDVEVAAKLYQKAAEQDYAPAQNNIGECFENGIGVPRDYEIAVKWYKKAVEHENEIAQYNLAKCYRFRRGVHEDINEAINWYRKAAEQGYAPAQNELGELYQFGSNKDEMEAYKWYRKAAEKGYAPAQYNLANCYNWKVGVNENPKESFYWFKKAAEKGYPKAEFEIGNIYYRSKEYNESIKWYQKAIDHGYKDAILHMGYLFEYGKKDYEEALTWYRKAAKEGISYAFGLVGKYYEKGLGVKQDYVEALKWYLKKYSFFKYPDNKEYKAMISNGILKEIKGNGLTLYILRRNKNSKYVILTEDLVQFFNGEFDSVSQIGDNYIKVKNNNYFGLYSFDGKEIIPISRCYTYLEEKDLSKGMLSFKRLGYSGICNIKGKEISITKLPASADEIKNNGGYDHVYEIMNGNKKYWRVYRNGKYGLTDEKGNVIVPVEMSLLLSAGNGYLKYYINGYCGIINFSGKIIIDSARGYTEIGDFVSITKRFPYAMNGYKGECDINGRQISRIKVEERQNNNEYNNKSVGLNNKQTELTNSNINNVKIKPGLLYTGFYNRNSQGRNINTGQFTGFSGPDWEEKVEIYKDSIVVQNTMYEYSGTSGQWKMYSCDMGSFGKYVYFVDQNFNMKLHIVQDNPYMGGSDIFVYTMRKDGTQNQKYYGDSNGQITSDIREVSTSTVQRSTTSNSSSTRPICKTCHGGGICNSCHGKGKRTDNQFGTGTNYARSCGVCGGSGRCPVCNGSGYR